MKVLVNRSDAIGDTLLTMPLARLLKESHPEAYIVFIVSPKSLDLFKNHPYVDEAWVLNNKKSRFYRFWFLFRKIRKYRPQVFLHVGGAKFPSFVCWLLWVRFRGGLKSKFFSFLFLKNGVRQKRSMVEMHEADYNLNLLAPLKIQYSYRLRNNYAPVINLLAGETDQAWGELCSMLRQENYDLRDELIVVHPGMVGHTLNWPTRNYLRLIEKLEQQNAGRFLYLISYTPADEAYLRDVYDELGKMNNDSLRRRLYFYDGSKKGLRNYMSLLARAQLFVGPSTGTTHIAATLGVPTIGIYSPIKVQSALRWGPFVRNEKVRVVVPDVICGEQFKCALRACPYYRCMAQIEVEEVFTHAQQLIG